MIKTRAHTCAALLTLMALAVVPAAPQTPEVIDRIVAAINHTYIVTASDVRKERAVMEALGDPQKDDRAILEDLVGWRLLEEQMSQFPGLDVTDEELQVGLKRVSPLAANIEEVREAVRNRIRRAKYIERRFGQFIHVTDEEKQKYYRDVFVPEARKAGINPIPNLDDPVISEMIQSNVFEEKKSKEVISALDGLRARSDVEIFQ